MPIDRENDIRERTLFSVHRLCVLLNIALTLIFPFLFSIPAAAQLVSVMFVNGRSGKPIKKGTRVWVYFNDKRGRENFDLHTGNDGSVRFDVNGAGTFQVSAVGFIPCGEQPVGTPARDYPVSEILERGLLTKNECGNMVFEARQGRLIYFVRPASWWELFKG